MGEAANLPAPEPISPGKWIARIVLAVVLAEAIWGFIVSLTNSLILPGLARVMGGDPQSPLYLGKGDFNLTSIFVSVLELCLAGIAALVLNAMSQSGPKRVRVKTVKVKTVAQKTTLPSIAPSSIEPPRAAVPAPPGAAPKPTPAPQPVPTPAPAPAAAVPVPPVVAQPKVPATTATSPPKPEKPKKPHEVYYNIVGEPINPTEDDE